MGHHGSCIPKQTRHGRNSVFSLVAPDLIKSKNIQGTSDTVVPGFHFILLYIPVTIRSVKDLQEGHQTNFRILDAFPTLFT